VEKYLKHSLLSDSVEPVFSEAELRDSGEEVDQRRMSASVLLATAGYGSIRLWQATSAQCRQSIQHSDSVCFAHVFNILSGLNFLHVRICFWAEFHDIQQVNRLDITSDKQTLAAAGNPNVKIYDIPTVSQNHNPVRLS
jgi:target of rapamycin complex subunit LST8